MSTSTCKKELHISMVILILAVSLWFCACDNNQFGDMKKYVNQYSLIKVSSINLQNNKSNHKTQEQNKLAIISVLLPNDKAHYTIDELESLRTALNDYMIDDQSSYLNNGYHVIIYVNNSYFNPTQGPIRVCAVFSNADSIYENSYSELNDSLCTAMYKPYKEDIAMIPDISGIRYLWLIYEGYSAYHKEGFPIKEINNVVSKIDNMEVLYIDSRYFELFDSTDIDFIIKQGTY